MKIFFCDMETGEDAGADAPVERSLEQTLLLLEGMGAESFLGIIMSEQWTLQMVNQEGAWWLEVLDTQSMSAAGALVTLPMAERAIEFAFENKDVRAELTAGFPSLRWEAVPI